jgi:hypothetical protein
VPSTARLVRAVAAATLVAAAAPAAAQPAPPAAAPQAPQAPQVQQAAQGPQPYERVVPANARTKAGLFTTHRIGDRLLFEIPRRELGRDILLVQEIAQNALGAGTGGTANGNRVLRFERRGNRILIRGISYEMIASDSTAPIAVGVANSNVPAIIAAFPIDAYGPDSAPVIDVTRFFSQPPGELSPTPRIAPTYTIDPARSWIERVATFPENVNVHSTLTLAGTGGRGGPPVPIPVVGPPPSITAPSATVVMSYSFLRLPETPMTPRLCDNRVGYYGVRTTDYSGSGQTMVENVRCYIARYRLEKKDPSAAMSEPVKPIVYYVDPATPAQWRPYVMQAIEDWQVAFEAAGFKRAIIARLPPTNDPDWSPEDARYSVIRWLASTISTATGPHVHDPRSGEILNAHVQLYHNVPTIVRNWYFTYAASSDPRARQFPLPDSLMGRLIRFVVSHEVGHTLGFQHNMKSSALYPVDSIRSVSFLERMGFVASLMDYARMNYVAQPEDHVPPELLLQHVGPYDKWATRWGYAPIGSPRAGSTEPERLRAAEAERSTLQAWAREQDQQPWLRFSTSGAFGADHGDETEAVGDADPVKATGLGLKNLKRNMQWIEQATVKPGEDYTLLAELYARQVGIFRTELGAVANLVGGMTSQEKYGEQPGPRFTPVPRARQQEAMRFLAENAFKTPAWLIDERILRKIEPNGEVARIVNAQVAVLGMLLEDARLTRMVDVEALASNPAEVYTLSEMLTDLRRAVWSETSGPGPYRIDAYRRSLQRGYVAALRARIAAPEATEAARPAGGGTGFTTPPPPINTGEIRAMLRNELRELDGELTRAAPRAQDGATRAHMHDVRGEIARVLRTAAPGG